MRINKKYQYGIRQDSKTSLTTLGVLGDTVVDIDSKLATAGLVQNNTELPPPKPLTSRMSSRPAREPSSALTPSSIRST